MEKLLTENWAAIRKARDDGHEFIDLGTLSSDRGYCEELAGRSDKKIGVAWTADNPVVRFSRVEIKEI